MKKNILLCFFAALLVSAVAVSADEFDAAMLTTDSNYPDTMVAAVAGNHIGAPVLLTGKDDVPQETLDELEEMNASTVYLIGGPGVISEGVEQELGTNYTVVRVWGMTRIGTAAEVATYFWENSSKAMIVWDYLNTGEHDNSGMLSEAKDLAIQEDIPVLLTARDTLAQPVVEALNNLSVDDVILVGNVGADVKSALLEMGINISDQIKGDDENETRDKLRNRTMEWIRHRSDRPLVVVAVGNWSDTIRAPYSPNGASRLISSESQIDGLIEEIQHNNYTRIKVVGKPALASIIYERLTEAGINATLITGRHAEVAAKVMKAEMERIRQKLKEVKHELRDLFHKRAVASVNDTDELLDQAEKILDQANISGESRDSIMEQLNRMADETDAQLEDGNYTQAWLLHGKLKGDVERLTWTYRLKLAGNYTRLVKMETRMESNLQNLRDFRNSRENKGED